MSHKRTLLIATAALLGAGLPTTSAGAASYVITACGSSATAGSWASSDSFPSGIEAGDGCPSNNMDPFSGLYARDILNAGAIIPGGSVGGWTFTAPVGLMITGFGYHRYLFTNDPNWVPEIRVANGTQLETCTPGSPTFQCTVGTPGGTGASASFSGLSTTSLEVDLRCALTMGSTNCSDGGGTQHNGLAVIYDPQVTITDNTVPSITATTGALWGGGYHSGTEAVTYSADDDSGISSATLAIDNNAPSIGGNLTCNFSLAAPCPNPSGQSLNVNTNLLSDGVHTITLAVKDAAGNPASTAHQITVDNNGPPPPNNLAATPTSPGSSTFNVSWTSPYSVAPIDHAMVEWCPIGSPSCSSPVPVSATSTQVTLPGAGDYQIVVWLIDAAGKGSANSSAFVNVSVPARPPSSGGGTSGSGGQPPNGGQTAPPGGGTARAPSLTLSGTLHGGLLSVVAKLPRGDRGEVNFSFRSSSHRHTLEKGHRTEPVSNGQARADFRLTRKARGGAITVHAVYDGASREAAVLRLVRAHSHKRR